MWSTEVILCLCSKTRSLSNWSARTKSEVRTRNGSGAKSPRNWRKNCLRASAPANSAGKGKRGTIEVEQPAWPLDQRRPMVAARNRECVPIAGRAGKQVDADRQGADWEDWQQCEKLFLLLAPEGPSARKSVCGGIQKEEQHQALQAHPHHQDPVDLRSREQGEAEREERGCERNRSR